MNFDEFVKTYNGKAMDYDSAYGVQCVDLAKLYFFAYGFGILKDVDKKAEVLKNSDTSSLLEYYIQHIKIFLS